MTDTHSDVLTEPARVEVDPFDASLPDAVVYLHLGDTRVLADLTTPIHDACAVPDDEGGDVDG